MRQYLYLGAVLVVLLLVLGVFDSAFDITGDAARKGKKKKSEENRIKEPPPDLLTEKKGCRSEMPLDAIAANPSKIPICPPRHTVTFVDGVACWCTPEEPRQEPQPTPGPAQPEGELSRDMCSGHPKNYRFCLSRFGSVSLYNCKKNKPQKIKDCPKGCTNYQQEDNTWKPSCHTICNPVENWQHPKNPCLRCNDDGTNWVPAPNNKECAPPPQQDKEYRSRFFAHSCQRGVCECDPKRCQKKEGSNAYCNNDMCLPDTTIRGRRT